MVADTQVPREADRRVDRLLAVSCDAFIDGKSRERDIRHFREDRCKDEEECGTILPAAERDGDMVPRGDEGVIPDILPDTPLNGGDQMTGTEPFPAVSSKDDRRFLAERASIGGNRSFPRGSQDLPPMGNADDPDLVVSGSRNVFGYQLPVLQDDDTCGEYAEVREDGRDGHGIARPCDECFVREDNLHALLFWFAP